MIGSSCGADGANVVVVVVAVVEVFVVDRSLLAVVVDDVGLSAVVVDAEADAEADVDVDADAEVVVVVPSTLSIGSDIGAELVSPLPPQEASVNTQRRTIKIARCFFMIYSPI